VIKLIGVLLAAVSTAALIFDLEFVFEELLAGVGMSPTMFIFGFALNLLVGLPVALGAGLPIGLVFRHWKIRSPWTFALAGALLALFTYVLLVAAGMGQPSDHPMTFAGNLGRSFHVPRIAFVMLSGASGAVVFWRFALGDHPRTGQA